MEFKTYMKGKNSIEATETAYEALYKQQGFKLAGDDGKSPANKAAAPADDGDKAK